MLSVFIARNKFVSFSYFYRVRTDPGKSWNFYCSEFQALESPGKGIGPGKSWKVLEL